MFKRILKLVSVNSLVLVAGLLIVEMIFGNWINPDKSLRLNLLRDVELTFNLGNLYEADYQQVRYRRDKHGFRGVYGGTDQIDILTVGGSTTDQRYITEGATWQDILRREFLARGRTVNIANAGIDGQSSEGYIKNFEWWFPSIPNLRVKYFLFYIGVNDFFKDDSNEGSDLYRVVPIYLKEQIKQKSALYHLYRTLEGMYTANVKEIRFHRLDFNRLEWTDQPKQTNHERLMHTRLELYVDRLRVLEEKVRGLGAASIYVSAPIRRCRQSNGKITGVASRALTYNGLEINGVDQCLMMQLLNKRMLDFCRSNGGVCIDLAGELEFEDSDFYDFYHNSPKGTEKIAQYLYQKLEKLNLPNNVAP